MLRVIERFLFGQMLCWWPASKILGAERSGIDDQLPDGVRLLPHVSQQNAAYSCVQQGVDHALPSSDRMLDLQAPQIGNRLQVGQDRRQRIFI